jgi:hypothetical protein
MLIIQQSIPKLNPIDMELIPISKSLQKYSNHNRYVQMGPMFEDLDLWIFPSTFPIVHM